MSATLHHAIASMKRHKATAHREFSDHLRNYRMHQRTLAQREKLGYPVGHIPAYIATARRNINTWSARYHSYERGLALLTKAEKETAPHG